jgi:hypothetical protein
MLPAEQVGGGVNQAFNSVILFPGGQPDACSVSMIQKSCC